jgi:hypothetical protein
MASSDNGGSMPPPTLTTPAAMKNAAGAFPLPLRLRARDRDDLVVLSAQLQDAIVPLMDMGFVKEDALFAMVVNRFRWDAGRVEDEAGFGSDEDDEAAERGETVTGHYLRTHCAVRFAGVTKVAAKNIDTADRASFLNLLAITADVDPRTAEVNILIAFSGGAWTRLTAPDLDVTLEDLGEPWPTSRMPDHEAEESGARDERSHAARQSG